MSTAAKKTRTIQRTVHLVASLMLLAYLYTPLGSNDVFSVMLRLMVIPMVTVSGLLMWQWPRIRRLRRQARAGRAAGRPKHPARSEPLASHPVG